MMKVDPRALAMDTAAMAITAYLVAEKGEPLGRRRSIAEVKEFLRKSGLEPAQEVQFGPLEP
jgi:hypothetical protein